MAASTNEDQVKRTLFAAILLAVATIADAAPPLNAAEFNALLGTCKLHGQMAVTQWDRKVANQPMLPVTTSPHLADQVMIAWLTDYVQRLATSDRDAFNATLAKCMDVMPSLVFQERDGKTPKIW